MNHIFSSMYNLDAQPLRYGAVGNHSLLTQTRSSFKQVLGHSWCANLGLWGCSRSSSAVLRSSLQPFSDPWLVEGKIKGGGLETRQSGRETGRRETWGEKKGKYTLMIEDVTTRWLLMTCSQCCSFHFPSSCHSQWTAFPRRPLGCHISKCGVYVSGKVG